MTLVAGPMYSVPMSTTLHPVVQQLVDSGDVVVVLTHHLKDRDRVAVSIGDVEAFGTIGFRSLHWSTLKGVNMVPVVLDGTGQEIEVHASLVRRIEQEG